MASVDNSAPLFARNWYAFVWHTSLSVGVSVANAPLVLDRNSTVYSTDRSYLHGKYDILYALVPGETRAAAWETIRSYYPDADKNDWGPRFQMGLPWLLLPNFRIVRREAREVARQLRHARHLVYGKPNRNSSQREEPKAAKRFVGTRP